MVNRVMPALDSLSNLRGQTPARAAMPLCLPNKSVIRVQNYAVPYGNPDVKSAYLSTPLGASNGNSSCDL